MAIKQKEKQGASVRSVEAVCQAGVRCEITTPEGHTVITDEPVERGGENTGHDEPGNPRRQFLGNKQRKYRVGLHDWIELGRMTLVENIKGRSCHKEEQAAEDPHPGCRPHGATGAAGSRTT